MAKRRKPISGDKIQQATFRARRRWMRYVNGWESELYEMFRFSGEKIIAKIQAYEKSGVVPPERLTLLLDNVKTQMDELRPKIRNHFRGGINQSVHYGIEAGHIVGQAASDEGRRYKVGIGSSYIGPQGGIHRYDPLAEPYVASAWAKIHNQAVLAVLNFKPSGQVFSDMIWDLSYQAQKTMRATINSAVITGQSAGSLSRDIRQFMRPDRRYRVFRRVRDPRTGKLKLSKAARDYHPGRGIYRSAYKNAMRVARTELNRAFIEGFNRYASTKPWITGLTWTIGGPNPCEICLGRAGTTYPVDDYPPQPHPHCMCFPDPEIVDMIEPKKSGTLSKTYLPTAS